MLKLYDTSGKISEQIFLLISLISIIFPTAKKTSPLYNQISALYLVPAIDLSSSTKSVFHNNALFFNLI